LWAGRLSHQKRLDLVRKIAQKFSAKYSGEVQIDVYGREQSFKKTYFRGLSSARYVRNFHGFNDLPTEDYDVFLYTSEVDGLPNVLLEATAAGLPIVASNEGGVSEFIRDGKTGKLVEVEKIDDYIAALRELHEHPGLGKEFVENAQRLLLERHDWESFSRKVRGDVD
jgi:glycosyltransferase involved in cell wall biosynthesis